MIDYSVDNAGTSNLRVFVHEGNAHVHWRLHFNSKSSYTADRVTNLLNPHGDYECECDNVLHPKLFRLMIHQQRIKYVSQDVGLYISCRPTMRVTCEVLDPKNYTRNSQAEFIYDWQYLLTPNWVEQDHSYKEVRIILSVDNSVIPNIQVCKPSSEYSMTANLLQMLEEGKHSDITLSSQDGSHYKAHKGILAQRCQVFRANLEYDQFKDKNIIAVPYSENTLKEMLKYLYTDIFPNPASITTDLLMAADYYELLDLKNNCAEVLCTQVTADNAIATLDLACKLSCKELKEAALRFIKDCPDLVFITEDWKNLRSVELLKMICEFKK